MIFRRPDKSPLGYALDFVEIAGESARRYLHDEKSVPTDEVFDQLKELEDALWMQHRSVRYILRTLIERRLNAEKKD